MRQAPIPYASALIVLAGLMWGAFQWGYGRILDQKDATIGTLNNRVSILTGERDDVRKQLEGKPNSSPGMTVAQRDPDALYQFGTSAARTLSPVIDRTAGSIRFSQILGGPDFNVDADMDYRQFILTGCSHGTSAHLGSAGFVTSQTFWDVTCRISGLHP